MWSIRWADPVGPRHAFADKRHYVNWETEGALLLRTCLALTCPLTEVLAHCRVAWTIAWFLPLELAHC
jgi:hypothetical protein